MTYTGVRTTISKFEYGEQDHRSFAAIDTKGRVIGSKVLLMRAIATASEDGYGEAVPPGPVFGYRPTATRNGWEYGTWHSVRWFSNEADRAADIERYFADAAKRASKKAAR